jgi:FkbM family methyltransferase
MELELAECVDGGLLFYPHLYDYHEMEFIRNNIGEGDCFVDAGANIGIYSLVASSCVGKTGSVIAIEADEYNATKLQNNLDANDVRNVSIAQVGLSDKREHLILGQNLTGNRGGHSFLTSSGEGAVVGCLPLLDLMESYSVKKIDGMKIDIEGFEFRVLSDFFKRASPVLYPRFLIVELNLAYANQDNKNLVGMLNSYGYNKSHHFGLNAIFVRES